MKCRKSNLPSMKGGMSLAIRNHFAFVPWPKDAVRRVGAMMQNLNTESFDG
jgi:hypothetical protein